MGVPRQPILIDNDVGAIACVRISAWMSMTPLHEA